MEKIKSYVISVNCPENENIEENNHDYRSVKYKKRRKYISEHIIPSLSEFCEVQIFDAVTPKDFFYLEHRIVYKNKFLKRGLDRNYNKYSSDSMVANSLSFYELYLMSKKQNTTVFLMEDDAFFPNKNNILNIKTSIQEFLKLNYKSPSILYLQSMCCWRKGFPIKTYPNEVLIDNGEFFDKIRHDWYDIAGNTGFVINPAGSEMLLEISENEGIFNPDQMTTFAMNNKLIDVYIPKNNKDMVMINQELQ